MNFHSMTKKKPSLTDLRNFVFLVWQHLGLPSPTPLQYSICEFLQEGHKRIIIAEADTE